ncbi:hypothetical protein ACFRFQ_09465 [Rhodococcus sp. NPDC056743]|uniref:hypothetical protein n=1 Tax=Rhodococcus sp. NPDC056743 TaxID=3345934 RepID=UPI0036733437
MTATDEPAVRQVVSIQRSLAIVVAQDHIARAGMLLSLELAVDEHAEVCTAWTSASPSSTATRYFVRLSTVLRGQKLIPIIRR